MTPDEGASKGSSPMAVKCSDLIGGECTLLYMEELHNSFTAMSHLESEESHLEVVCSMPGILETRIYL